jgi:GTP cyclohydrolase II
MLQVREWTGEGWRHSAIMSPDGDGFGGWLDYALTLDATGAIVVTRVTSSTLDVFRWSGSEWERLAPTDDVLADLPLSVRVKTANEGGDVLFSYFEDCAWRGLSASDRGGGVSNSTAPSGSRGVVATEDVVCVAWAEGEGENMLMRCHERPF